MYASSFFAAALATRFCIGCSACFKNALLRCEYRDLFTLITLTRMLTMSRSLCSLIRGETQPEIGQGTKLLPSQRSRREVKEFAIFDDSSNRLWNHILPAEVVVLDLFQEFP